MSDRLSFSKSLVQVLLLFKLSLLLLFGPGLSSLSPDLKRNIPTNNKNSKFVKYLIPLSLSARL